MQIAVCEGENWCIYNKNNQYFLFSKWNEDGIILLKNMPFLDHLYHLEIAVLCVCNGI